MFKYSTLIIILIPGFVNMASVCKSDDFKIIDYEEFESIIKTPADKIQIFNFSATWCAPCVKEIPDFEKVQAQDKDVELIFISLDDGNKTQRVQEFIKK